MNTKLQELTDKIYLEGVEKGNAQAAEIVDKAGKEAEEIVKKAKAEAAAILQAAESESAELKKNTRSELKLFARQSVDALKSEITGMICGAITSDAVKTAVSDKEFMQKMILTLVQELAKGQDVTIQAKDAAALEDYFKAKASELLTKGVSIKEVNGIKTDFTVVPSEGGYKLTFGEDEFIAYFKEFLRPKLIEMLF